MAYSTQSRIDQIHDPISIALQRIYRSTGLTYSVKDSYRTISKFGRHLPLANGITTTIAELGIGEINETYIADNLITHVVSDDAADTVAVRVRGFTIDGSGNFTRVTQQGTLTGLTPVALATPLVRAERMSNEGATDLVGTVSVIQGSATTLGVPDDPALVHVTIQAGFNQSFKCAFSTASDEYCLVFEMGGSVERASGATSSVDFDVEVRKSGGVFQQKFPFNAVAGAGTIDLHHGAPILVSPSGDIRVRGTANANATSTNAHLIGIFAKLVS